MDVYGADVKDLTPLVHISTLESLGLQCKFSKAPDFSQFNKLRIFKATWRPKVETIFNNQSVEHLNIENYPYEDLSRLYKLEKLERLQLTSRKLVSLKGIEKLKSLKILDLYNCQQLQSLYGVERCQSLKSIEIESCKKLTDANEYSDIVRVI